MQFDESPSLDQFENGMPENMPDPNERRRKFRLVLLVLTLVVGLVGAGVVLKNSRVIETVAGTGVVRGTVMDENGGPFHGSIFVLGTDLATETDANGHFELSGVPAGKQILIVADDFVGRDFTIQMTTASVLEMGEIRFESTAIAPP